VKELQFYALIISRLAQKYLLKQKLLTLTILGLLALILIAKQANFIIIRPAVSEGIIGIYTNQNLPSPVTNLLSEGLITLDQTGKPLPNLVSGWQVNNDATIYTLKLKDNLTWNDGTPVRSSEIIFHIPNVKTEHPDDRTIVFKLDDSFSPFPSLLTQPIFKGDTRIGVGKYNIFQAEQSRNILSKITLTPRDNAGRNLPTISIRFYPDEKAAKTAFSLGEIDSLIGIPEDKSQKNVSQKKLTTKDKLTAIFYNTKDKILSDKNLRKALSFETPSIPSEEKAKGPIHLSSWAFNPDLREYLDSPPLAKNYLEKANLGDNSTITLTTTPQLAELGEKIISAWKNLGIDAVLRVESGVPQNFQALLFTATIPADPDQYSLWHSTQNSTNISQYSSPRADKDLEDGRKTSDPEKRKEKYTDFQRVILEDAPATFLYFPGTNVIYRTRVEKDLDQALKLQFPASEPS